MDFQVCRAAVAFSATLKSAGILLCLLRVACIPPRAPCPTLTTHGLLLFRVVRELMLLLVRLQFEFAATFFALKGPQIQLNHAQVSNDGISELSSE
jgi:hypothetical protein